MRFNKTVAKAFVFALGLGAVSFLGGYTAKAAQPTKPDTSKITLKTTIDSLSVGDDIKDNAKFWGIAKEAKNEKSANFKKTDKNYTITDINPLEAQTIDLSSFSKSKKVIIAVGATETVSDTLWDIIEIEPATKLFAVEYLPVKVDNGKKVKGVTDIDNKSLGGSADVGYLVATSTKEGTPLDLATYSEKIEVQEGDSAWVTFKEKFKKGSDINAASVAEKLTTYVATGKTLKFRLKEDGKWNSNEVSVKLSPLAKAPVVKFDTTKGVTNLKKGMEVKIAVTGATGTPAPTYIDATDKMDFTALKISTADGLEAKGGTITVRTKATTKNLASKEVVYTITKQDKPTVADTENVQEKEIITTAGAKVKVALKVKYDFKKGAELINEGDKDYEYYISYTGAADPKAKWRKLPKQKTRKNKATPTKVSLKYSATEKEGAYGDSGSKIFIRLAGDKQNGTVVTLASPVENKKLEFSNIDQTIIAAKGTVDNTTNNKSTITTTKGTASAKTIVFTMKNLQKKKSSPKIKVTQKVNGVSVKAEKFTVAGTDGTSVVTIKIAKSAFKKPKKGETGSPAATATLKFTISAEGGKHEHEVSITANN